MSVLASHLLLLLCCLLPITVFGKPLQYTLKVTISPAERKISGTAQLVAEQDQTVTLTIPPELHQLQRNDTVIPIDHGTTTLTLQREQPITLNWQLVLPPDTSEHYLDIDNVFLTGLWYPRPLSGLINYALQVTLPNGFMANSEAEQITVTNNGEQQTFTFNFPHPADQLHLSASRNYVKKQVQHGDVNIETYFFKEDAALADSYIEHAGRYLDMYSAMLTPYPYRRLAIVANPMPVGYSMPTYTLLGQAVLRLPFIVETSLGHEILHQWFGNSVYTDYEQGNWSEGLVTYLADHHYAALKNEGADYRKQLLIDYHSYVNEENALPAADFRMRANQSQRAIGYGKVAMLFHDLRQQLGDKSFFTALRRLIRQHIFQITAWTDIQQVFEQVSSKQLDQYFSQWLTRKDLPELSAQNAVLYVAQGRLNLQFTLKQAAEPPYELRVPVTVHTAQGSHVVHVTLNKTSQNVDLTLEALPTHVTIDEQYDLMRQLSDLEIPPVLSQLMGNVSPLLIVTTEADRERYEPLINALSLQKIMWRTPKTLTFADIQTHSLLIGSFDNPVIAMLLGKQAVPGDGLHVSLHKNPYQFEAVIALLNISDSELNSGVMQRLGHYGRYSHLAFVNGKNTLKETLPTQNGIAVISPAPVQAIEPGKVDTLEHMLPDLLEAPIIYIGEQHDQFSHHINQLRIIRYLHEAGRNIAIGLEMFQRPYQVALDDYLAGKIDEKTVLAQSRYFETWRYDYNLYKPIIDYAVANNIPLVALNIDSDITRKVGRQGLHSLTAAEQAKLPVAMDFSDESYRHSLYDIFTLHSEMFDKSKGSFNFFLQAQLLWDETMAESIDNYLQSNADTQMVVLAGNGHIQHRYGIPSRVERRNGLIGKTIVQGEEIKEGISDYVLISTPLEGKQAPRLGVIVTQLESGVTVKKINKDSPAELGGLQAEDVILYIDDQPIEKLLDLNFFLFYANYGDKVTITLKRGQKMLNRSLELFPFE